ncbi:MAG: ATP-binding protein [Niameybacter sp.]
MPRPSGLLIQSNQLICPDIKKYALMGELSLNGNLRACSGVLPMVIEAKTQGIKNIIVPLENLNEARLVRDLNIFAFEELLDVVSFLQDRDSYSPIEVQPNYTLDASHYISDFSDVKGQDYAIEFICVAAMNPCPCGYFGDPRCRCTDYEILKYRSRLSGPIMDRIDIQKNFRTLNILDLQNHAPGPSSKSLRKKVEHSRAIQKKRYKQFPGINCNAQMTPNLIETYCQLDSSSIEILRQAYDKFNYSARTYHKFLKLARTFADMEGKDSINKFHIIKALMCREIEKEQARLHTV